MIKRTRKRIGLIAAGGIFLAIGGLGFVATAVSAAGGLAWLPARFEWPIGSTRAVVVTPDGTHVVPHTASGRIQLYDRDWRFLRGWPVDASGGVFVIRRAGADRIELITARRQMRYVYNLEGSLLSREGYAPKRYSDFAAPTRFASVPTPWWLWVFSSPVYCYAVASLGGILLFAAFRTKQARLQPAPTT